MDDVARLIAFLLQRTNGESGTEIVNVAGHGEALTMQQCATIAGAKLLRLPTQWLCRLVLNLMWKIGLSGVPPKAFPYIIGSYTMDTTRLHFLLGNSYKQVMRHSVEQALADTFREPTAVPTVTENAAASS